MEGHVDCLTSEAERHVAFPPHEALLAVAVSADAKIEFRASGLGYSV